MMHAGILFQRNYDRNIIRSFHKPLRVGAVDLVSKRLVCFLDSLVRVCSFIHQQTLSCDQPLINTHLCVDPG